MQLEKFDIIKLYSTKSTIFRWIFKLIPIIPIIILGGLDMVNYNWHQGDYSGRMTLIILISVLTSIITRFFNINLIRLILIIISDFTLVILINRGIIEGNYFSRLADFYFNMNGTDIFLLGLYSILLFDWMLRIQLMRYNKNEKSK